MTPARGREVAYELLARELRSALLQQQYPQGSRLPTEAELASTYGMSRQTVRRAFQDLVAEGMVVRVPGRGTFPASQDGRYLRQFGSIEDLMGLSLDTELEVLNPLRREANITAASRLRLESDVVFTIVFRRIHNGRPFCQTVVHLPPSIGTKLADVPELAMVGTMSRITIIGLVEEVGSSPTAEAAQSITAEAADESKTEVLGCRIGDPLLRIDRLYSTAAHQYVELAISHFVPDQYSYRVQLRRSV